MHTPESSQYASVHQHASPASRDTVRQKKSTWGAPGLWQPSPIPIIWPLERKVGLIVIFLLVVFKSFLRHSWNYHEICMHMCVLTTRLPVCQLTEIVVC